MAFGQRGVTPARPTAAVPVAIQETDGGGPPFRTPKLVRQLAKIAATIVFFTASFNAFPLFMRYVFIPAYDASPSRSPSEMNLNVASAFGEGLVNATEATINAACITKADMGRYAVLTRDTGTVPGLVVPLQYRTSVERATSYLACLTAMKTERFCDNFYRAQLADNLQAYFTAKRYYVRFLLNMQAGRPVDSALDKVTAAQAKSETSPWSTETRKVTLVNAGSAGADYALTTSLNPKLAASLRGLVRRGLFSADDFGWLYSPPEEIVDILSTEVTARACT
ncbi:MAG: hypothetical protein HY245_09550 [Rhizobiales bacterium]|nr:hypothetical protein [Hyphomicrobiales bacterium]MBI3673646.1 hypothetical protein [Hyphomicrobiales bacterium]